MVKSKKNAILLSVVCILSVILCMVIYEIVRYHQPFESQRWKADIASRCYMKYPIKEGMKKSEVLNLLGKPDYQSKSGPDGDVTFVYCVPSNWLGEIKAAEFIYFKKDVVDSLRYDDADDEYYPGGEFNNSGSKQ